MNYITSSYNHTHTISSGEHLSLEHIIMVQAPADISLTFNLAQGANLMYRPIILGGNLNLTLTINLQGEGARAQVNGAYVMHGTDAVTIQTAQRHEAPHAHSMLAINGVLSGAASLAFSGMIYIAPHAAGTNADQQNKTIVLSPHAHARSIPSIEVLNYDVQCAHGSAISYLDESQVWYAAARGLPEAQARPLLLAGFLASSLDGASLEARQLVGKWL